ncbi:hypothetical protein PPYR_01442 [Photinus pyralis]|uniref:HTH CENPB-type domain-containing protein n=1 Tax=Photinus pyralis TaxID=7054 RepID=A0A5N4B4F3_PHOPY|nr:hypothetical protein PPYR_01442 [Photinus pyralis]
MVRTYKTEDKWNSATMQAAVRSNTLSIRKSSQRFNIPKTCLLRRLHNVVDHPEPRNDTYKQVFTAEQEKVLLNHILDLESRFYGITATECRKLAFDLAESLNIKHPFNKDVKLAGYDWFTGFRKRNPQFSIRAPEPTSVARAVGFNRPQVERFFSLIESTLRKHNLQAHQIFNIDECGFNTVPVPRKILAHKGKKQVGCIATQKKGKGKQQMKNTKKRQVSSESEDDQQNTKCLYCNSSFLQSKSGEGWIQCLLCKQWAHDACAGVEDDEDCEVLIDEYQKTALEAIRDVLKQIRPTVTIADVKAKFNGLRTNFLNEYKKYEATLVSGTGDDNVYRPTIWYFDRLHFLLDNAAVRESYDFLTQQQEVTDDLATDVELAESQEYSERNEGDSRRRSEAWGEGKKRKVKNEDLVIEQAATVLQTLTKELNEPKQTPPHPSNIP